MFTEKDKALGKDFLKEWWYVKFSLFHHLIWFLLTNGRTYCGTESDAGRYCDDAGELMSILYSIFRPGLSRNLPHPPSPPNKGIPGKCLYFSINSIYTLPLAHFSVWFLCNSWYRCRTWQCLQWTLWQNSFSEDNFPTACDFSYSLIRRIVNRHHYSRLLEEYVQEFEILHSNVMYSLSTLSLSDVCEHCALDTYCERIRLCEKTGLDFYQPPAFINSTPQILNPCYCNCGCCTLSVYKYI